MGPRHERSCSRVKKLFPIGAIAASLESVPAAIVGSTAANACHRIGGRVPDRGWTRRMSSPEGELQAQSICDLFNSPLISDQIAGRRNYYRLPPISMILADLDFYLHYTQRRNNHVG